MGSDQELEPWESELGKKIWKNQTAWFTWLRGLLRRGWNHHPLKIATINRSRYQIPNPNVNGKKPTVWGFDCSLCGGTFPVSHGQIDHITEAGQLNKREDIQGFVERLLMVTEHDLRLICKDCNSACVLQNKQGISFQEARATKAAILMEKDKSLVPFLLENGYNSGSSIGKNAKQRRQQAIEILMNQGEENV